MTNTRLGQGTRLEREYGRALGWYPARWRRTHGPAMLGTLLDVAEGEGRTRPVIGELADLRWQGIRERVNSVVPTDVRALAASIGTGSAAGFALVYLVWVSWAPWDLRPLSVPDGVDTFGPFWNAGMLFCIPLLLSALAALTGARWLAHLFVVVGLVALPVTAVFVRATEAWNGPRSTTLGLAALLCLVTLVGDPRRRRALGWSAGVVGGALSLFAVFQPGAGHGFVVRTVDDGGFWQFVASAWMLAAAAFLVVVVVVVLVSRGHAVVGAAVALAWLPWGGAGTVALWWFAGEEADAVVMAAGTGALVVLALTATRWQAQRSRREQA